MSFKTVVLLLHLYFYFCYFKTFPSVNTPAWTPAPSWELLTVDGFLGRESQFSFWVWLLVGGPHSRGRPHTPEHMGSTNWVIKKKSVVGRGAWGCGGGSGRSYGKEWDCDQNTRHEKSQIINTSIILKFSMNKCTWNLKTLGRVEMVRKTLHRKSHSNPTSRTH